MSLIRGVPALHDAWAAVRGHEDDRVDRFIVLCSRISPECQHTTSPMSTSWFYASTVRTGSPVVQSDTAICKIRQLDERGGGPLRQ